MLACNGLLVISKFHIAVQLIHLLQRWDAFQRRKSSRRELLGPDRCTSHKREDQEPAPGPGLLLTSNSMMRDHELIDLAQGIIWALHLFGFRVPGQIAAADKSEPTKRQQQADTFALSDCLPAAAGVPPQVPALVRPCSGITSPLAVTILTCTVSFRTSAGRNFRPVSPSLICSGQAA